MSIKVYYTKAESYDLPNTDLLFKIECFDSDCYTVEIKTVITTSNMDDIFELIKKTITDMDNAR